jgi:3-oxoadipate enol-lactonase
MPASVLHHVRTGTGPWAVLLHPIGLDLTFWRATADALASSRSVVAVDLPGHGLSPAAQAGATVADYADDVARLLRAIGVERAEVVGLSFGGMIAQELALRHPDLVSCLVPCGCPSRFADDIRPNIAERGAAAERGGMAAVLEPTLARWFTPDFLAAGEAEPVRRRLLSDDVGGWAHGWRAIAGLDTHSRLAGLRVPAICIAGARDEAVPPRLVEEMAAAIPGAEFRVVPGAPHMMHVEGRDAFLSVLLPALREPR